METKSRSCPPSAAADPVRLDEEPLSLSEATALAEHPGAGAVVAFSGNIRDQEKADPIRAIRYEAYTEMALKELRALVAAVERRWNARAVIFHRIGVVPAGESSLIIVTASKHRPEAFEANRFILEEIKAHVPIWKVGFQQEDGSWSKALPGSC